MYRNTCLPLKAGGEVHIIADDRVLHALDRTDRASKHFASCQPDGDLDRHISALDPPGVVAPKRPRIMSVATNSALSASAALVTGAPKIAINPSPKYLSSMPPCVKITSTISVKCSFSIVTVLRGVIRQRFQDALVVVL
jgi:hypothetical protein